jgi:hypothetical protein
MAKFDEQEETPATSTVVAGGRFVDVRRRQRPDRLLRRVRRRSAGHDASFTLLYAPNVNSYKRFVATTFAPTRIAWGLDNRTCAVRLVGSVRAPAGEPRSRRRRQSLSRARGDARGGSDRAGLPLGPS